MSSWTPASITRTLVTKSNCSHFLSIDILGTTVSLVLEKPGFQKLGQMIPNAASPIRIALIDDDASVRSGVSRLLRSHDYVCRSYESAESALADPDLADVDCLVIDVQLSGMNGFALRDRLLRDGVPVPCLFITAHADTDSAEWTRSVGSTLCVIKPFDESQLLAAIHKLLDRSQPFAS